MATASASDRSKRIGIADPAGMRRGAWRSARAGIILLILLTGFTAGGISMLQIGELPGLPFAVGGATAQLAVIAINVATLRIRSTLCGDTVSQRALLGARAIFAFTRAVLLAVMAGLAVYTLVRLVGGDPWTLLTTAVIGVTLGLLFRGTGRLRDGVDTMGRPPQ